LFFSWSTVIEMSRHWIT